MLGRTSCAAAKRLQRAPIGGDSHCRSRRSRNRRARASLTLGSRLRLPTAGTFVGTLRAVRCRSLPLCVPSGGPWRGPSREKALLEQPLSEGTWERPFPCPCADRAFRRRGGGGRGDAANGGGRSPCALGLKPHRRRLQAQCPGYRLSIAPLVYGGGQRVRSPGRKYQHYTFIS